MPTCTDCSRECMVPLAALRRVLHPRALRRMCSPLPVDVVYTWVNGTDPVLLHNLAALKLQMEVSPPPPRLRDLRALPHN